MPSQSLFCVLGMRADGVLEVCAAKVTRATADSVASTLHNMGRNYSDILVQEDGDGPILDLDSWRWD